MRRWRRRQGLCKNITHLDSESRARYDIDSKLWDRAPNARHFHSVFFLILICSVFRLIDWWSMENTLLERLSIGVLSTIADFEGIVLHNCLTKIKKTSTNDTFCRLQHFTDKSYFPHDGIKKKNYNVISSIFLMAYPGGFLWSHTLEGPLVPNATDFGYQF